MSLAVCARPGAIVPATKIHTSPGQSRSQRVKRPVRAIAHNWYHMCRCIHGELLWKRNRWRTSGSTFSMAGWSQTARKHRNSSCKAFMLTVTPSGSRLHEPSSPGRGCCSTFDRGRLSATSWSRYGKHQAPTGSKSRTLRDAVTHAPGSGRSWGLSRRPWAPDSGKLASRPVRMFFL